MRYRHHPVIVCDIPIEIARSSPVVALLLSEEHLHALMAALEVVCPSASRSAATSAGQSCLDRLSVRVPTVGGTGGQQQQQQQQQQSWHEPSSMVQVSTNCDRPSCLPLRGLSYPPPPRKCVICCGISDKQKTKAASIQELHLHANQPNMCTRTLTRSVLTDAFSSAIPYVKF